MKKETNTKQRLFEMMSKLDESFKPKLNEEFDNEKRNSHLKTANVFFKDPKYNYNTSVNGNVPDDEIIKYFKGNWFNLGSGDKDNMQQCIDCIVEPSDIKEENNNELTPFWRTPEAKDAKSIYYGEAAKSGDYVLTKNGDIFEFVYGHEDTTKQPYLKHVKNIGKINQMPIDDIFTADGKKWDYLGNAEIFKLKNGLYLWEY